MTNILNNSPVRGSIAAQIPRVFGGGHDFDRRKHPKCPGRTGPPRGGRGPGAAARRAICMYILDIGCCIGCWILYWILNVVWDIIILDELLDIVCCME